MLPSIAPAIAQALAEAKMVTVTGGGGPSAPETTTNNMVSVIQTVLAAQPRVPSEAALDVDVHHANRRRALGVEVLERGFGGVEVAVSASACESPVPSTGMQARWLPPPEPPGGGCPRAGAGRCSGHDGGHPLPFELRFDGAVSAGLGGRFRLCGRPPP
jgi:hypothetical protein